MVVAKLFEHEGAQALSLPEAFRFEGTAVTIEKRGDEVILRSIASETGSEPRGLPGVKTLHDVARYMRENHPYGADFPDVD